MLRWVLPVGLGVALGVVAPGWVPVIVVAGALVIVRVVQIARALR